MPKSTKTQPDANGFKPEMVRITITGLRPGVDQIIREFYLCRFSETSDWTSPQPVPNHPNLVTATYTRRLR